MNETHKEFWFPVKRFGWGWGAPVKWQGWALIALYVASVAVAGIYFPPRQKLPMFASVVLITTVVFVAVVALRAEKPLAWRSGKG